LKQTSSKLKAPVGTRLKISKVDSPISSRYLKNNNRRLMKRKRLLICILLTVLGAALTVTGVFVYRVFLNPRVVFGSDSQNTKQRTINSATVSLSPDSSAPANVGYEFTSKRVNILVLGMDSNAQRLETDRVDFRTDTILLVSIDFEQQKVDMITVPRDSYVTVTKATGSRYKVNAAAYFGGGECDSGFLNACDTISGVFGVPVDYYVAADMDGMKALVDAIGGIYYDVDIEVALDGVTLQPGYQLLDGEKALAYCRMRKKVTGGLDVERQKRQQKFLVAVLQQLKSGGRIGDIPQIYKAVDDMLYTNLSFEQICALAVFAQNFNDLDDIGQHVLKGEYHWAYNVYYYLLDQQAKAELVKEIFGIDIVPDTKHDINYVKADKSANFDQKGDGDEEDKPTATPTAHPTPTVEPDATGDPSTTPSETATGTPADADDPTTPSDTDGEAPSAAATAEPSVSS